MKSSTISPIKVGVITDMTGPLSLLGIANANIAKMVIHDINDKGGLLGRQLRARQHGGDPGAAGEHGPQFPAAGCR